MTIKMTPNNGCKYYILFQFKVILRHFFWTFKKGKFKYPVWEEVVEDVSWVSGSQFLGTRFPSRTWTGETFLLLVTPRYFSHQKGQNINTETDLCLSVQTPLRYDST